MESAYASKMRMLSLQSATEVSVMPCLHQRFSDWYKSLPEISRHRPFAMAEFELALNVPGKLISPVLLSMGWTRKRKWTGGGHYPRYWVPPIV